jgi:flagellar biosynthesis regulator FlaF
MSDNAFNDDVYVATMHRADAPSGRTARFHMDTTGMEGSAAWVFDTAERIVALATGSRVWVSRIEACESRNNVVTLIAGPVTAPGWA